MKKILLMGFALLACFVTVCGCDKKEDNKDNDNKNVEEKDKVGMGPFELKNGDLDSQLITQSLKLTNTKFTVEENKTTYSTSVTNTSNTEVKIYELHIIIKNSANEEMVKFITRIDNLAAGETKDVSTSMDFKLEGYKTVQYEIIELAQ